MGEVRFMISEAAKQVHVEAHVLRYWEDELDLKIGRTEMGHRYYTEDDIQLFRCIQKLKDEGVMLKDLKPMIHELTIAKEKLTEPKENAKLLEAAVKDMETITGQKAVLTRAKNSVANFKIREGMPIGCKVTLRGEKMYEFVDRLINLSLPRVRDFRGVNPNAFDGRGNYALGIKEQLIFPEIEYDKIDKVRGMDVIFVTTAKTDEEARELLRLFNMPFQK